MKDFKLPVTLENQTDATQIVVIVPAAAEMRHELKGRYLTTGKFGAVAVILAGLADAFTSKPTEDHVINVSDFPLDLEKIQRYIAYSAVEIDSINVMSPNGEQLGLGFVTRVHDAVTPIGFEDFEMPEIGELILKKEGGKHFAQHDFKNPFKSGPFDSLMYVILPKTKVELVISAKYTAISNAVLPVENSEPVVEQPESPEQPEAPEQPESPEQPHEIPPVIDPAQ